MGIGLTSRLSISASDGPFATTATIPSRAENVVLEIEPSLGH